MSEKKIIRKNSKTEPKNFLGLLPLGIDARHEFTPQVYLDNKVPKKLHPKFVIKPFNNELKRKWLRITKLIYLEEVYLSDKTIEEIKKYDEVTLASLDDNSGYRRKRAKVALTQSLLVFI